MAETVIRITNAFLKDVSKVYAKACSTMKTATLTWIVIQLSIVM